MNKSLIRRYSQPDDYIDDIDQTRKRVADLNFDNRENKTKYELKRELMMIKLFDRITKNQIKIINKIIKKKGSVTYPIDIDMKIKTKLLCNIKGCEHKRNDKNNICDINRSHKIIENKLKEKGYKTIYWYTNIVYNGRENVLDGYVLNYKIYDNYSSDESS